VNRYFNEISFLGNDYFGWQTQPRERNVQDTITEALQKALQQPDIKIVGCGRTDTGVHASQFYFHFDIENEPTETDKLTFKLNRMLPPDIAIKRIFKVNKDLHARFDAFSRTYQYHINYFKNPFLKDVSWHHNRRLDIDKMNEAAGILLQTSDFAAFSKTGGDNKTTFCNVTVAEWQQNESRLLFTITADRFLRNMVRAIVGTLVDVGMGNIGFTEFKNIIESKSRSKAGTSAPAKGLFLTAVNYPQIND
jgi:tRNA pseudouridine38-40 synthase